MQSAVVATIDSVCLSVRLSVCHSPVLCRSNSSYDRAVFTGDSLMTLVSSWLTSPRNSKGNIGREAPNGRGVAKVRNFSQ